jgi:hypothetical protein
MDAKPSPLLLRRRRQLQSLAGSDEFEEETDTGLPLIAALICITLLIIAAAGILSDAWRKRHERSLEAALRNEEMAGESFRRQEKERLAARRKERREWYENYFKPCTMVRILQIVLWRTYLLLV